LDVFEIDGASNNGIEQIRELKASLRSGPSGCRFKIYIIDEVHMLSPSAFNSLQRVIEEPPPHSKFIFATTEMDKLPSTFSSRCQCLCLQPLSTNDIARHLLWIAEQEGFRLSDRAALSLAEASDGGLRDAESMLDQVLTLRGNKVDEENICEDLGIVDVRDASRLITHIFNGDLKAALLEVEVAEINGTNLKELGAVASALIRDVFLAQAGGRGSVRGST
jgi:DNA polymerase-3 subunit gamma/tau